MAHDRILSQAARANIVLQRPMLSERRWTPGRWAAIIEAAPATCATIVL